MQPVDYIVAHTRLCKSGVVHCKQLNYLCVIPWLQNSELKAKCTSAGKIGSFSCNSFKVFDAQV